MPDSLVMRTPQRELRNDVLREHAVVLGAISLIAILIQHSVPMSRFFAAKIIAIAVLGAAFTAALAIEHLSGARFGAANRVTLVRGALIAFLLGSIGETAQPWLVVIVAATVLALDGVDGFLARRQGIASDFGARFDMETDALLLVALTLLLWQSGKAGPWILLAGAMRYGFVGLARLVPRFARPLPESLRRKTAFVVTVMMLIGALAPVVGPALSHGLTLLALVLLTTSFAIDVAHLARSEPGRTEHVPS